jgi:serine/threonine-protein kinase RsbW
VSLIRLQVPGSLDYRDLAIRVVASACKLVHGRSQRDESAKADFDNQVVSAFGEAFNNAAIHSYQGRPVGTIEVDIELADDRITLRISDHGVSFDPTAVKEPDLDSLPESGLGLFIIRSFMDTVRYHPGAPNVLSMTKHLHAEDATLNLPRGAQ